MSKEKDPAASGAGADDGVDGGKKDDTVSFETYKKTVGEAKALRAKLAELEAEKEQRESDALKEQGKWKEVAETSSTKAKDAETKLLNQAKQFGQKVFNQEVRQMAHAMGALPEALEDIVKVGDWSTVDYDAESFVVDKEKLKAALAAVQKAKPYLFGRQVKAPSDLPPGNERPNQDQDFKGKFEKMKSADDVIAWAKANKGALK